MKETENQPNEKIRTEIPKKVQKLVNWYCQIATFCLESSQLTQALGLQPKEYSYLCFTLAWDFCRKEGYELFSLFNNPFLKISQKNWIGKLLTKIGLNQQQIQEQTQKALDQQRQKTKSVLGSSPQTEQITKAIDFASNLVTAFLVNNRQQGIPYHISQLRLTETLKPSLQIYIDQIKAARQKSTSEVDFEVDF